MRISRGSMVIGDYSVAQVKKRFAEGDLLPTDSYYDEDASDWLPLTDYFAKLTELKADKTVSRACYCGSELPFHLCCGDGTRY